MTKTKNVKGNCSWDKFKTPAKGVTIYLRLLDNYRRTSRLYNLIPFNFKLAKNEALILFAIVVLTFAWITEFYILSALIFTLLSTEYVRVFNYRMELFGECILNEEMFKITLERDGLAADVDQGDPLFVTLADQEMFFMEARSTVWSKHLFEKIINYFR